MSDKNVVLYKTRKTQLKKVREIANRLLNENKEVKPQKNTTWERERVENNIARLKEIIAGINKNLTDEAVKVYVFTKIADLRKKKEKNGSSFGKTILKNFKESILLFELAKYSVSYSIENDFYWNKDGTINDHLELALGIRHPDTFGVYCEGKVIFIQEHVIPYLASSSTYNCDLISSIMSDFKHQQYANSNILLMVVIEGMTREMCKQLYIRQNPTKSIKYAEEFVRSYQSLETLVNKPNWKNDIPHDFFAAVEMANFIDSPQLEEAKQKLKKYESSSRSALVRMEELLKILSDQAMSDVERNEKASAVIVGFSGEFKSWISCDREKVYVSIKVELQFLVRRFKDDRNEMIHGRFDSYNKKWKSNIYLSAVIALYKLMIRLDAIYTKNNHIVAEGDLGN
ncbi:hypothetical protein [Pedobacter polysacchareus]|uniref:hypothetical protein n=1 Tax=Pedobacter polysacchareus TaxID=2861973 RepID=UPI001C9A165B|nr:hypothetical protein [Pedobacter polysacchareus]